MSSEFDYVHLFYGKSIPKNSFINQISGTFTDSPMFLWLDKSVSRYRVMMKIPDGVDKDKFVRDVRNYVADAFIWVWLGYEPDQIAEVVSEFKPIEGTKATENNHVTDSSNDKREADYSSQAAALASELDGKDVSDAPQVVADSVYEELKSEVSNTVNDYTNSTLESSLDSINGVIRSKLNISENGVNGTLDALVPLYENDTDFVFSQSGVVINDADRFSGRDFANTGLGFRSRDISDNSMYGLNTFYDHDLTRGHQRLSLGAEYWQDSYSLYTNYYFPISSWKESEDSFSNLDDMLLEERPAQAFDLGVSGYIEEYPWVTLSLEYGQVYGEFVENADGSDPTSNPFELEASLDFTPIPLINLGVSNRYNSATGTDFTAELGVKYVIGESISKQLDPGHVIRTKAHDYQQKTKFVERNSDITLEYRKKPFSIELVTDEITLRKGDVVSTADFVAVTGADNVKSYGYEDTAIQLIKDGNIHSQKKGSVSAISFNKPFSHLLTYSKAVDVKYSLIYTATLKDGRKYQTRPLRINIEKNKEGDFAPGNAHSALEVTVNNAVADGTDTNTVVATLADTNGNVVAGETINFSVSGSAVLSSASGTTDASGQVSITLTNTTAEVVTITATHSSGTRTVDATFVAGDGSFALGNANSTLEVTVDNAAANGADTNTVVATLADTNGNVVAGETINFSVSGSAVLSSASGTTDASGQVSITLTNTTA
ncbi:inverse autotransporter beta domain-containing protein, partial [Vibrio mediterranei]|uniref:inverse autotransporter beta domain-containing protein n=1 Tax=Vibrio mediterranei TaxID=689 RepID=UPI004067B9F4